MKWITREKVKEDWVAPQGSSESSRIQEIRSGINHQSESDNQISE